MQHSGKLKQRHGDALSALPRLVESAQQHFAVCDTRKMMTCVDVADDDAEGTASLGFEFAAMASRCELRIAGLPDAQAHAAASAAMAEVQRIETSYSRYRPDTLVSRINAAAGSGQAVEVDEECAQLLTLAGQLHAQSGGLFDITSGVLRRVWDFQAKRLPAQSEIDAVLPLIGWPQVQWDAATRRFALPKAGMQIDFGGFGKEYACDRAATVLQQHGTAHGFVDLGGDVRVIGPKPGGAPWQIAIAHPRGAQAVIASLPVSQGALATSGDYERYFDIDGKRYCHILNPRTGWPVRAMQSVSVLASHTLIAGAITTTAMLKEHGAIRYLNDLGVAYLAVDDSGKLHEQPAA
jgi:FAD:protein FMN transferase